MKFSVCESFDCERESGIMKKRNYLECADMERPSRCAQ
jgi:hypothetical protein